MSRGGCAEGRGRREEGERGETESGCSSGSMMTVASLSLSEPQSALANVEVGWESSGEREREGGKKGGRDIKCEVTFQVTTKLPGWI